MYAERMLGQVNGEPLRGLSVVDPSSGTLTVTQQQHHALDFKGAPFGTFQDVPYVLQCSFMDGSAVSGCSGPLVGLTLGASDLTSTVDQAHALGCGAACDTLEVRLLASYQLHEEALGDFAVHDGTTHILGAIDPLPRSTLVLCAPGDPSPECGIDVDADGWFYPTDPDDLDPDVFPGASHPPGEEWRAWDDPGILETPVPLDVNGDGYPMDWTDISFEE